jgi:hypothetical protein
LPQSRFQLLVLVRIAQGGACLKRGLGRVEHPLQHLEVERVIESFGGCERAHRSLPELQAGVLGSQPPGPVAVICR